MILSYRGHGRFPEVKHVCLRSLYLSQAYETYLPSELPGILAWSLTLGWFRQVVHNISQQLLTERNFESIKLNMRLSNSTSSLVIITGALRSSLYFFFRPFVRV